MGKMKPITALALSGSLLAGCATTTYEQNPWQLGPYDAAENALQLWRAEPPSVRQTKMVDGGRLAECYDLELRAMADAECRRHGRRFGTRLREESNCIGGAPLLACTVARRTMFVYCEPGRVQREARDQ